MENRTPQRRTPSNRTLRGALAAALGACALGAAGTAGAAQDGDGYYVGVEAGFASAASLGSEISGVNHPTACDSLLYAGTGVAPPTGGACAGSTPATMGVNEFDLDTGFAGGLAAGYARGGLRFEIEYFHRGHDGENELWGGPGGNAGLASKGAEWSANDPPAESVSDFKSHQFFANAYRDFANDSPFTPYLGAGIGVARVGAKYSIRFVRKPDAEYLAAVAGQKLWPAGSDAAKRAAAGTLSLLDTEVEDDLFGYQILAGADYELREGVSIGVKARWARFGEAKDDSLWDLVRSHKPVRADGTTPFDSRLEIDDIEFWALSVGLKYRF